MECYVAGLEQVALFSELTTIRQPSQCVVIANDCANHRPFTVIAIIAGLNAAQSHQLRYVR